MRIESWKEDFFDKNNYRWAILLLLLIFLPQPSNIQLSYLIIQWLISITINMQILYMYHDICLLVLKGLLYEFPVVCCFIEEPCQQRRLKFPSASYSFIISYFILPVITQYVFNPMTSVLKLYSWMLGFKLECQCSYAYIYHCNVKPVRLAYGNKAIRRNIDDPFGYGTLRAKASILTMIPVNL